MTWRAIRRISRHDTFGELFERRRSSDRLIAMAVRSLGEEDVSPADVDTEHHLNDPVWEFVEDLVLPQIIFFMRRDR